MKNIIVEGHRGFAAKYPENTLISFEAAIELGVDAIEFDVWLSSDGIPVIMHDGNAYRTAGVDRELRCMTLSEIRELEPAYTRKFGERYLGLGIKVPTLEEVLILCREKKPDIKLGVEIKEYTEENVDLTVALLKKYGFFDCSYFYAFNGRIISYIKKKHGGRTMGYPDFYMAEFSGYEDYDEIGIDARVSRSEVFDIQKKGLPDAHVLCRR